MYRELVFMLKMSLKFLSKIYSYQLSRKLSIIRNQLYTIWLSSTFKYLGNKAYIERPIYIIGGEFIHIGAEFKCFKRLRIEAIENHNGNSYSPIIVIGDNVSINYDCHIGCINRIEIHDNVLLASRVFITDHFHGEINDSANSVPPSLRKIVSKGPVIIGKNVWVGEGVAIMPGVHIGANSIIGANSVITKDIPENSVVAGIPGRVLRSL